jgi:hypothetical protein
MVTWNAFAAAAPGLAEAGRRLIYRTETGEALLASVRGDEPPRIHPIYVPLIDGRLYAFLNRSAKATDLATDGRYALHTHQDPAAPASSWSAAGSASSGCHGARAGRGRLVLRDRRDLDPRRVLDRSAVLGERESRDEWPPRYSSWRAEAVAALDR